MTTYSHTIITAGRNAGWKPWRDCDNPEFVYHLRDLNQDDVQDPGFQLVKINVKTGAVVDSGPQWLEADNYGTLGAAYPNSATIHTSGVNLASVSASSKLYLFASSGFGAGPFDNAVIEFDKSTLDVTNDWAVASGTSRSRDRGVAVMNLAGTILANAGNSDITVSSFTTSYIDLFKPSDGTYLRVDLNASLGITGIIGLYYSYDAPICFDQDGFLWFITSPWADGGIRADRATGTSTLYKCSVNSSTLALTIVNSYSISDGHYSFDAGSGSSFSFSESHGYRRMVCNPTLGKIFLWSDWRLNPSGDAVDGWFWEWDTASNTFTRGPLDWLSGSGPTVSQKLDTIGFTKEDYLVRWEQNPPGFTTSVLNIFKISDATERTVALNANFAFNQSLSDATFFHTFDVDDDYIYAMDVDFTTISGWQYYRDGLFSILEASVGGALVGGTGFQLEPLGCILDIQPFALEVRDLNGILELGPFRFAEQKESDETSMVTTLILGLTEADTGLTTFVDMMELSGAVDMDTLLDVLGDDIFIDMGEGDDNSDDFTLELLGNDDGSTFPGPPIEFKPEVLQPIEDRGSVKQYSPIGYSFIYHRLRLKATQIDEKFAVKFVDLSGQLTGRLF